MKSGLLWVILTSFATILKDMGLGLARNLSAMQDFNDCMMCVQSWILTLLGVSFLGVMGKGAS